MSSEKYATVLHAKLAALLCAEADNRKSDLQSLAVLPDLLSQSASSAIIPLKWPTVVIFFSLHNINVTMRKAGRHGRYTRSLLFLILNGALLSSFSTLASEKKRKETEVAASVTEGGGH